jgi:hypothetical protein
MPMTFTVPMAFVMGLNVGDEVGILFLGLSFHASLFV